MASEITSVRDEEIQFLSQLLPLMNLRQDLEVNLFDNSAKCEECECECECKSVDDEKARGKD